MKHFLCVLAIVMVVVLLNGVPDVLAEHNLPPSDGGGGDGSSQHLSLPNPLGCNNFGCVIGNIIRGITILAIPLLTLMVLVSGFQIMTSSGDPEKLKRGWKTLIYSVVGFVIILLAEGVRFIIVDVLGG